MFLHFHGGSDGKEPACNAGDLNLISLGWGDLLEEGMVAHACILAWRIPMDRGTWCVTAHGGHKKLEKTELLSTQHGHCMFLIYFIQIFGRMSLNLDLIYMIS